MYGKSPALEALAKIKEQQNLDRKDLELMLSGDKEAKERFFARRRAVWKEMGLI